MRAFCSALKKCKNVCPCNPQGQFGLEKGGTFWLFPFWGKPGTHRKTLGVNLTQGSREAQRKRYYLSPIQPLSQNLRFCQLPLHRGAESRPPSERCDFLPFRGGAAAAAEGVVIYRLPCRTVLFCAEKSASRQDSRAK